MLRNKKLIKEYPFLLPRNRWTGKVPDDYDYSYTEYDDLAKGWQIGFGKFLLEDLKKALVSTDYLHEFRIMQWKEKYGSMRLYTDSTPQEVFDIISDYEYISEHICIQCGSPHATVVNEYGWFLPVCEECWDKNNKHWENRVSKTISYKDACCGDWDDEVSGLDSLEDDVTNSGRFTLPDSYTIRRYSPNDGEQKIVRDISYITERINKAYEKRMRKRVKREEKHGARQL